MWKFVILVGFGTLAVLSGEEKLNEDDDLIESWIARFKIREFPASWGYSLDVCVFNFLVKSAWVQNVISVRQRKSEWRLTDE